MFCSTLITKSFSIRKNLLSFKHMVSQLSGIKITTTLVQQFDCLINIEYKNRKKFHISNATWFLVNILSSFAFDAVDVIVGKKETIPNNKTSLLPLSIKRFITTYIDPFWRFVFVYEQQNLTSFSESYKNVSLLQARDQPTAIITMAHIFRVSGSYNLP